MAIPYELTGRTHQKTRTREVMLRAARELLAEGFTPTVEQAADRAAISRTTAYRYFRNQRALLVASYPEIDARSLLGADAPADPAARLEILADRYTRQLLEHEAALRAMLRLSLDVPPPAADALPLRRGRAITWIEDALAPLRHSLAEPELRRLVLAIRTTLGVEALVWLCDVAHLTRAEAAAVMKWSACTLLRAAMAEMRLVAPKGRRRISAGSMTPPKS